MSPLARLVPSSRLRTTALGLCLWVGAGLTGCLGGGDGKGGGDGGAGAGGGGGAGGAGGSGGEFGTGNTPAEQFYKDVAGLACDTYYRCCPNGINGTDPLGGRANCVSTVVSFAGETTGEAINAGKAVYDAAAGGRCLNIVRQRLSTAQCGGAPLPDLEDDPAFADCKNVFVGQVPEGESCIISGEPGGITTSSDIVCAPGLGCFSAPDAEFGEPTCNPIAAAGGACSETDGCEAGLYCPFSGGDRVCTAQKADGTECQSGDECLSDNCDYDQMPNVCAPEEAETGGDCGSSQKRAGSPLQHLKVLAHLPGFSHLVAR